MKNIKKLLTLAITAFTGGLFAYDTYYWTGAANDNDIANAQNWASNSVSGTVPTIFPPTLDKATGGSTHPLLRIPGETTLSLPNNDLLTVNWIGLLDKDAKCTIDLGSKAKSLILFGGQDASLWIGGNFPDGQSVLLKSGTLKKYSGSDRRNTIRLGGVVSNRGNLATFIADGVDAAIEDMAVWIDSGNVLFSLTNGATMRTSAGNAVAINTGVSNATFRVVGEGSLFAMTSQGSRALMMGDGAPASPAVPSGGTFEVLDGGVVSNIYGTVGNRSGYHTVVLDNGKWYTCNELGIGSYSNSCNNSFIIRNRSYFGLATGVNANNNKVIIGGSGHDNTMAIVDSEFHATIVCVGCYAGSYGNTLAITNSTIADNLIVHIGGQQGGPATAKASTNNFVSIVDCELASNVQLYPGSGMDACSNRLELVRTSWISDAAFLGVGGIANSSSSTPTNQYFNSMRLDDQSSLTFTNNNVFYLGRNGSYNSLEIVNASTGRVTNLYIGSSLGDQARTTVGNSIYVGTGSLLEIQNILTIVPQQAKITIEDGTFRCMNVINWNNYWSITAGKTVDNLANAEADGVIFDTEVIFRGSTPRFESTATNRDFGFGASVLVKFELPEEPYEIPPIFGSRRMTFSDVAGYTFDLSKVGEKGGVYTLAEATTSLVVDADELAAMNAALPQDRRAKIYTDGLKLKMRIGSTMGMSIIVR